MKKQVRHPLYYTYKNMKSRCYNKKAHDYPRYGAKGITICDRWLIRKDGFRNFLKDMGPKPDPTYQIDRIDNTKGYSPENCRWASPKTQILNRTIKLGDSGYRGVRKVFNKWHARITNNSKEIYIGLFNTKEEAAKAYDTKAIELHGEHAQLNFPKDKT